ncbi:MAG TPA: rod shape-determining protein [Sphingomicrobium sp.]|jgi:rod shape-determining protein MreB|nr:rod shape-determining protein [Sphingomicrobium sp.]
MNFGFSSPDVAIDLGTANTLVFVPGQGIVIDEPSVVAVEVANGTRRICAVGAEAKILIGKTPGNIVTYRPLTDGVIGDLDVAEEMIKHFIHKAIGSPSIFSRGPEIVVCVPSSATPVERRAIRAAAFNAGGREVWLVEEPMAAAIGAGLPVDKPIGSMVVDIGGGTTEVGIVSLKGLTFSTSIRVGGDKMDEAIAAYVRRKYNLQIGDAAAETVKKEIGSALVTHESHLVVGHVRGQDVARGVPCEITLSQAEIAEALQEPMSQIAKVVSTALEQTKPEIAADIIDRGITMTGGGSLLRNIDLLLADETGLPVRVAETPLICVALGAGRTLEDPEFRGTLCPA